MPAITKIKKTSASLLISSMLYAASAPLSANSDMMQMEQVQKARQKLKHKAMGHDGDHMAEEKDVTKGFKGIYYGYLPCDLKDCNGFKMTLSLKQRNKYLLVTQYAKAASREYYEKGIYDWDAKKQKLTLIPKKKNAGKRLFTIKDDSTLIVLRDDGLKMRGNQNDYALQRSDSIKTRQVHIH